MHTETNPPSGPSPSFALGLMTAGSGADLLDIEARGEGLVARIELGGVTFRVQLDRMAS